MPDYSMGGFGSDNNQIQQGANPSSNFNTQTFNRGYNPSVNNMGSLNNLNNTVQTMMKSYLRRDNTGGYLPLTSTAPQNFLQSFTPLDKYRSFGVPLTGPQSTTQQNSYDALFSSAPGSY